LLRPGRFDRQVVLDAPSLEGRVAILEVHSRGKPLAKDVELRKVARSTPGMSGADLANVMNEAALIAARAGAKEIGQSHLEEAVERIVAGPEQRSRRMSEDEKRRVAIHETGHALVAAYSEQADPVHKITIVPRGKAALGYTLQLPTGERHLLSRSALLDRIRGMLGGRAAEDVILGEVSTGAENDLEQATNLVRHMVAMYGMGESVRLAHCARPIGPRYLSDSGLGLERDCSEATAREIDQEVIAMLDEAYADARGILEKHREELDRVSETLIERETLDGAEFYRLIGAAQPKASPDAGSSQPVDSATQ
jgi:cell division protease FtsH